MQNADSLCSLEGKVAIVTGAGQGIGRGVATVFAKAGADIVIAEINAETAAGTKAELESFGRRVFVTNTDVTDQGSVSRMLAESLDALGQVDVLVNNVGGLVGSPRMVSPIDMDLDYWEGTLKLNLTSCFLCSKALITHWVNLGSPGTIVNIASLAAMVPFKTSLAYGAAKAGVVSMTTTLATLYGKNGIRVNCIAPGHVKTPITDQLYKGREEVRAAQDRIIPLGRYGTPIDFGNVAAFLASDTSAYLSGQTIVASGGMHYFLTEMP